jgi:hypothetical protein
MDSYYVGSYHQQHLIDGGADGLTVFISLALPLVQQVFGWHGRLDPYSVNNIFLIYNII